MPSLSIFIKVAAGLADLALAASMDRPLGLLDPRHLSSSEREKKDADS